MALNCALAIAIACALAAFGCADAESELEPQTPVNTANADHAANAQWVDPTQMRAPDIADSFPVVFADAQRTAPPLRRTRSVSLGFIGDTPLGTEATPPHHEPYWTRPFPCHWTGTCGPWPIVYVSPH